MGFSYSKSVVLKPKREKWLSTFFISLIVAACFFVFLFQLPEAFEHLVEVGKVCFAFFADAHPGHVVFVLDREVVPDARFGLERIVKVLVR